MKYDNRTTSQGSNGAPNINKGQNSKYTTFVTFIITFSPKLRYSVLRRSLLPSQHHKSLRATDANTSVDNGQHFAVAACVVDEENLLYCTVMHPLPTYRIGSCISRAFVVAFNILA